MVNDSQFKIQTKSQQKFYCVESKVCHSKNIFNRLNFPE